MSDYNDLRPRLIAAFAKIGAEVLDWDLSETRLLVGFATEQEANQACAFFNSRDWDWIEVVSLPYEKTILWYVKAELLERRAM